MLVSGTIPCADWQYAAVVSRVSISQRNESMSAMFNDYLLATKCLSMNASVKTGRDDDDRAIATRRDA